MRGQGWGIPPNHLLFALGAVLVLAGCSTVADPPATTPTSSTVLPTATTMGAVTTTGAVAPTTVASCDSPEFALTARDVTVADVAQLDASTVAYASGEPPSGPNAIAVAPDGTVWITDTEAVRLGTPRLLQIGCNGPPGTVIDLAPHQVASVVDVKADGQGVWIADFNLNQDVHRVLRLDKTGDIIAEYEIPEGFRLFDGFTGLELGHDGSLLLEKIGIETYGFVSADGASFNPPTPWSWVSQDRQVTLQNPERLGSNEGAVTIGDVTIPIVTTHALGGIAWLGDSPDGSIFVVVTELYDGPVLEVDETVWRLSPEGEVTDKARVPVAERYLYLEHPLAVTPQGEVMLMLALEDELVVKRLEFVPGLQPILPTG